MYMYAIRVTGVDDTVGGLLITAIILVSKNNINTEIWASTVLHQLSYLVQKNKEIDVVVMLDGFGVIRI